jgi:hypothetical protein
MRGKEMIHNRREDFGHIALMSEQECRWCISDWCGVGWGCVAEECEDIEAVSGVHAFQCDLREAAEDWHIVLVADRQVALDGAECNVL